MLDSNYNYRLYLRQCRPNIQRQRQRGREGAAGLPPEKILLPSYEFIISKEERLQMSLELAPVVQYVVHFTELSPLILFRT